MDKYEYVVHGKVFKYIEDPAPSMKVYVYSTKTISAFDFTSKYASSPFNSFFD